ncbi:MAG: methylated-DNA--[protein]-cysteine S-methyltransferase [Chloroflexi bacterium]|nr:methylated-DNA--[protein]-cysteine S-methyltransferase [Chloroflexota bacterium]
MNEDLKYVTFNTDMGWVGILASAAGLLSTTLPQTSLDATRQLLGKRVNEASLAPQFFEDLVKRLRAYYGGRKVAFRDKLDLSAATLFQRKVWETARQIPYGETRSYLWLAEKIGQPQAGRAVGQALGKNPLPVIVPCHRVVATDGKLGGFTGGLEMKRQLLHLEASAILRHQ